LCGANNRTAGRIVQEKLAERRRNLTKNLTKSTLSCEICLIS
jgi:hypothetical protein